MIIQSAKQLIWDLWRDLAGEPANFSLPDTKAFTEDVIFYGSQPIGVLKESSALFARLYQPLARAFPKVQRCAYIFLGGVFEGHIWVATTGHFVGVQQHDWLDIPAGSQVRYLRFGEFYRIEQNKIVEIRCLFDILGLAAQAGFNLLPPFAGRAEIPPGPIRQNGVCLEPQSPQQSAYTLQLIEDMLGGCNRLDARGLASMGMQAYWHQDMVWHGPWGIGSCYGFDAFQNYAQEPSVASFPDRRGGFHRARIAEGVAGAFTGWPSLCGTFNGIPFRGIAPTGQPIGQNIMDFYIRRDDKLHENWVLIDLIDFAMQCDVRLLDGLKS